MSPVPERRTVHLTCIKECVIPSMGQFSVGDVVTDDHIISKLKDHPFFTDGPMPNAKEKQS